MAVVPKYAVPKEQASALLRLALLLPFAKTLTGKPGCQGIRFALWGIAIESYTCYTEPVIEPWRGPRLIFWKTLKEKGNISPGWRRWRGIPIGNTHAVGRVHEHFLQDWAANARRMVTTKKPGTVWKLVSLEEFSKAYHASGYLDAFLRHGFIRVIKDHIRVHPEDVSILCFFNTEGRLAGGTVFVDYPDIQHSHYLISFLTETGRKEKTGYDFIYWWYRHMLAKGLIWADFGIVWAPGDPISWKGYSQFKKRFHPELHSRVTYWLYK